ncbi:hypothetical protein llap_22340 [Limosa lapponica baueri]|uniref:Uncharacterized protein n=1 Tax=Limosa lapponica baueri TaxID=1758121 RepID=A0A2I0T0P8_LIMLA|nr:hypothetical protein llap_22340 [Limosa lapponica baueri]
MRVPYGVTSPASKPAPSCGLLSPRVHRSCQESAPVQASHGITVSSRRIHLLRCGVLHGLQMDICSTVNLHGLQGDSLPHYDLHHRLQGNLCFDVWSTSSPCFFFTNLGVCRVVSLTYSHSSLPAAVAVAQKLFPLLKYVITEMLPPSLIGSALAEGGSVLELAGSIEYKGSF